MKTSQQLSNDFYWLRGELRKFRGELDMFLMVEHPGPVRGFESSESRNVRYMRRLVDSCITYMDRYEMQSDFHKELESMFVRLDTLAKGGAIDGER